MWVVRDSDGAETLHSIYPYWAKDSDHLTVTEMVTKSQYEAAVKTLDEALKEIADLRAMSKQHMRAMRQRANRLREVESANNTYYALLQRHNIYSAQNAQDLVDNTPLIDAKV